MLTLTTLRSPDSVPPETRRAGGGEFTIGRGPDNDWVLPDPERHLSKRHCVLAFRSGEWWIADLSSNGTFLNRDTAPIGHGGGRALRSGDRLRIGAYEIEVQVAAEAPAPDIGGRYEPPRYETPRFENQGGSIGSGMGGGLGFGQQGGHTRAPTTPLDPFGEDPFAPTPAPRNPFDEEPLLPPGAQPGLPGQATPIVHDPHGSISLGQDFAPIPQDRDLIGRPTQSDHRAAIDDAFRPAPPAAAVLPEDWDDDFGLAPPAHPAPPGGPAQAFAAPALAPSLAPVPPPIQAPAQTPIYAPPPPVTAAPPVAPVAPTAPTVAPPQAPVPAGDLMAAFLRGAGLPEARPADPLASMEAMGAAFRAMVTGLRASLIARATVKGEFRIEQTMIRARGNNPLKFSAGDEDALLALVGTGRRSDMGPAEAIADALRDMRLHELATVAAMQAAVRALLRQLDPTHFTAEADKHGGGLLSAPRKSRAFDAYDTAHAKIVQALTDDFDSVFGRAFALAYEQAMEEAEAKDRS
jgi:type VI secretion system protein ImpI/type VI secretion system protein